MAKSAEKIAPPKDELNKKQGACPWCEFEGEGPDGLQHVKATKSYDVREISNGYHQCDNCGKTWERAALNKPYTIELERGVAWARENRIKELGGRA